MALNKPKIVILGAGYGGLMTVTRLTKHVGPNDADITLVNKHNYHYETTWMHEASAGTLHHDRCRYQIKDVINQSRVNFVQDTVKAIKIDEKKVMLANGELQYDYLVIGLGAVPETFGIKGLKEFAFPIANINTSRVLREHIELQFATYNIEAEKRPDRLTIVVGGAGFTGIEFLGELAARVPELCKEYDVDRSLVRIICVEAAPTVLPGFDPELVDYAVHYLEENGVEFKIGTAVQECTAEGVTVGKKDEEPEQIKSQTVVWAAGVRGHPIVEEAGFENMRGRVKVNPDLRAPGHDNVFILGDSSLFINEDTDRPYPPTAQIAMQQGTTVAKNIAKLIKGGELEEFKPDIKGTVASLGEHNAVGVVYGRKLKGTPASFMKKVIDNRSLFLIGGLGLTLKKGKFKFF
ncbi:NAD(P)/FAD-dependent oxidoreductase [Bacillus mojavensis]|uniref:NAD(P)/FAD-dependent oxidoreductase n=1 Tax=Bacillus mojavensis TaxID=72360 RepID=UPI002DBA38FB|nr:NAD(P)/FAD-dependent oxidoreductase [Bacillus mojavensis]MEC1291579.1 NAD(P)/FAD-dependent oxidoreductase [Bacillus mojavensis]MEC1634640.1 NAD(P)/FAD-dependent oxidoreductase [Bacillus mojavensis]MEC1705194.1 NAD(P)/FAD-dependent oxidoreductase [Bacillus mojavensis]MEC5247434.1 NAD(P)/FAD-dependent oxidoreductase [Bacillus mojavensis]